MRRMEEACTQQGEWRAEGEQKSKSPNFDNGTRGLKQGDKKGKGIAR